MNDCLVQLPSLLLLGNSFILSTTSSRNEAHLLVYQIKEVPGEYVEPLSSVAGERLISVSKDPLTGLESAY